MRHSLRWLLFASLMMFLLAACTRNRPTPDPTATAVLPDAPVSAPGGAEPAVEQATPAPEATEPTATPTEPGVAETFEYRVERGDTLFSVALKFETDVDTLRKLNYLIDDSIIIGQILQVPYKPGMTEAGAPTPTPEPFRYTVEPGDTLSSIARKFNVTTIAIVEANGLLDPNSVVVGQEFLIPGYQPPAAGQTGAPQDETAGSAASGAEVVHVVQPGEGLLEIATKYGVDANALAQANNITNRNLLRVGQRLVIPGLTQQQAARLRGTVHVVQSGESLSSIAARYGVTVNEIMTMNAIADPNQIFVGQELIITTGQ